MSARSLLILLLLQFTGLVSSGSCQPTDRSKALSELKCDITSEIQAIRADPASAPEWAREWAGEYTMGPTPDCRLVLSPKGIVYTLASCFAVEDLEYARIKEVLPDRLILEVDPEPDQDRAPTLSGTIRLICWGDRHYVVPESMLHEFYKSVALIKDRPRLPLLTGFVLGFVRAEDQDIPLVVLPNVPPEYQRFLDGNDSEGPITAVGDAEFSSRPVDSKGRTRTMRIHATVAIGSEEGICPGMTLRHRSADQLLSFEVLSASAHTCEVVYTSRLKEGEVPAGNSLPIKGMIVTTGWD